MRSVHAQDLSLSHSTYQAKLAPDSSGVTENSRHIASSTGLYLNILYVILLVYNFNILYCSILYILTVIDFINF